LLLDTPLVGRLTKSQKKKKCEKIASRAGDVIDVGSIRSLDRVF